MSPPLWEYVMQQNIAEEYKDNVFCEPELVSVERNKGNVIITHGQEALPIYQMNAELKKYSDEIWSKGKTMKWVGRIPILTYLLWEKLGITRDKKLLNKMLNRYSENKVTTKTL